MGSIGTTAMVCFTVIVLGLFWLTDRSAQRKENSLISTEIEAAAARVQKRLQAKVRGNG